MEETSDFNKFLEENIDKDIERIGKKITKYEKEVKKYIIDSKRPEANKEKLKKEAIGSLKKKKFYEEIMEKLKNRKFKIDMKIMDQDIKKNKVELEEITKEFKRKIALLTNPNYEEEEEEEEKEEEFKFEIDMPESEVEEKYQKIIVLECVQQASDELNMFKFIFQS